MDESETLSFTNHSVNSTTVRYKPYSFLNAFNPNNPLANFECFLGGNIPLKVNIVGYFHSKHCPVEVTVSACKTVKERKVRTEGSKIFYHLHLNKPIEHEDSWDLKQFSRLHPSMISDNQQVYEIWVEYGNDHWILFKTYAQIFALYQSTKKYLHKSSDAMRSISCVEDYKLPALPKHAKDKNCGRHFKTKKKIFCQFFNVVFQQLTIRNMSALLRFLEISYLTFVRELGSKRKEGLVLMKKTKAYLSISKKRWLVVKDSFVCYLKDRYRIGGVFLMDKNFKIGTEANFLRKNCFVISNGYSRYRVQCFSEFDRLQFLHDIKTALESTALEFVMPAPNESFAPARFNARVRWFIDNLAFFEALVKAVESARDEIFIAGWFLSPFLSLRPTSEYRFEWCLDIVLKWKALQGVRVYIMLSREFEFADIVKQAFENVKNITILSHPLDQLTGLKSIHNEQLVIVDQAAAFLGGMDSSIHFWNSFPSDDSVISNPSQTETEETQKFSFSIQMSVSRSERHQNFHNQMFYGFIEDKTNEKVGIANAASAGKVQPTLMSHDVTCCVIGGCARDAARHFIQCWNAAFLTQRKKREKLSLLMPRSYDVPVRMRMPDSFRCLTQVLRSASEWSAGLRHTEASIHEAILSCINSAQHFIYIENQAFNSLPDDSDTVLNEVSRALVEKIATMHSLNQPFRVFVLLPLVPTTKSLDAFNFSLSEKLRAILYRQQFFLSRGEKCFLQQLQEAVDGADLDQFVSFCGLRDFCSSTMVTYQIQIYSKVWIFDDREVILGSANISDHSLVGYRDSEVCLHIRDTELRSSCMNGNPFKAGKFSTSLRKALMAEHLGLDVKRDDELLKDPVGSEFYENVWRKTAKKNTKILEKVFSCYPSNSLRTFQELQERVSSQSMASVNPSKALGYLRDVRGHLVHFPLHFLCAEELRPRAALMNALSR